MRPAGRRDDFPVGKRGQPQVGLSIKAQSILHQELRRLGWQEADWACCRKRDPRKVEVALRLRKETTLSVNEIGRCRC
jgi:hypothetical protein